MKLINSADRFFVAGANGMAGSAITRALTKHGYGEKAKNGAILKPKRDELDLLDKAAVNTWMNSKKPDIVILAAAKVGGIVANNEQRTQFLIENLRINTNILESCIPLNNIKIINLGSSCIYPLNAKNPISEDEFMNGKLEPTNSPYAMAKLTAIELGNAMKEQYGHKVINLMPTNLYGPNDNYSLKTISKFI